MFKLYNLIIYSGMVAFIFLCLTFFAGIFEWSFTVHHFCGWAAFLFACVHTGLAIYKSYKYRSKK